MGEDSVSKARGLNLRLGQERCNVERKHARCLYDPVQHTHSRSWLTMPADDLGVAAPIITLGLRDVIGMSQSR